MDGENNGKPYFLMDDLGGKPPIFGNIHIYIPNIQVWLFPKMGVPNNHGVFLLKTIILGCFGGTTI